MKKGRGFYSPPVESDFAQEFATDHKQHHRGGDDLNGRPVARDARGGVSDVVRTIGKADASNRAQGEHGSAEKHEQTNGFAEESPSEGHGIFH